MGIGLTAGRQCLAALAIALGLLPNAFGQRADMYPVKPITMIVPYTAGGSTDATARLFAKQIGDRLGQPVVVDYKPGANTMIGGNAVAKSAADGYTIMMGAGLTVVINPLLYPKIPYDAEKDLDTLAVIAQVPLIAQVPPGSPAKDLDTFVTLAKASPGKLNYGSVGLGGTTHLATELLKLRTGIDITNVPYKGSANAQTDFLGGQLDLLLDAPVTVLPQVAARRARAIAVTSAKRLPALPDVPTLNEKYPGLVAVGWFCLLAPAGMPREVRTSLKRAVDAAMQTPEVKASLEQFALLPMPPQTDAEIAGFLRDERERWAPLIRNLGLRLDMN